MGLRAGLAVAHDPTRTTDGEWLRGEFQRALPRWCLNENWFSDLADAREKIAQWKQDYNEKRPHSSLQYRTPVEFAAQAAGFYRNEMGQECVESGSRLSNF
jgi:transposase InsO family protein